MRIKKIWKPDAEEMEPQRSLGSKMKGSKMILNMVTGEWTNVFKRMRRCLGLLFPRVRLSFVASFLKILPRKKYWKPLVSRILLLDSMTKNTP